MSAPSPEYAVERHQTANGLRVHFVIEHLHLVAGLSKGKGKVWLVPHGDNSVPIKRVDDLMFALAAALRAAEQMEKGHA